MGKTHMVANASFINNPEHWKQRAQEMRLLAEDIKDDQSKTMMLRIAEDYEKIARRAVERSDGVVK